MTTVISYLEVDDSTHWLASPKRKELFGPLGITHRTFTDPENPTAWQCSSRSPTWRRSMPPSSPRPGPRP